MSNPTGNPLEKLAVSDGDPALAPLATASGSATRVAKGHSKEAPAKSSSRAGGGAAAGKSGAAHADLAAGRKVQKGDEDADTELVAAMIARLDRRGAGPSQAAAGVARHEDEALAGVVRKCNARSDPLDARRCRNKACDKRWGKVAACPSTVAPKADPAPSRPHGEAL